MRKLWNFPGGIRFPGFKQLSNNDAVRHLPVPERVYLPLRQHIGAMAKPVVAVGERVNKGQLLAEATSFVSAPVHASISGTVIEIGEHTMPHPSGITEECIVIESDGKDHWYTDLAPLTDVDNATPTQLRDTIRNAGIVGLGGAVFPSAVKLKPPRLIDTLIINGVECEPYITCDDMLMRNRAEVVLRGCLLLQRILNARQCILAVEDNKPEAIQKLRFALDSMINTNESGANTIELVAIPTVFPAGGEKQLIKVLTGLEVPAAGLPYELGVVCLNVGTTAAVHDAILLGQPLVSRIVTVTGNGIKNPGNYQVPLGMPIHVLLDAAGMTDGEAELIMGGPMMGQRLTTSQAMVVKGTNCILVNKPELKTMQMPCIRCGSCADACPMKLLPQQLYWHARGKSFDKLKRYHLDSCIECGCCNMVCPSHIPLTSYFRYAKTEIADQEFKHHRAEESRLRSELRLQRLERIKKEAEERKAKRKAARSKSKVKKKAKPAEQDAVQSHEVSNG
jgi:electron transport complex protein RnfC